MKQNMKALGGLVGRSVRIFLKDKAAVFFSLLAPLIVLLLYVLFLGNMQVESLQEAFEGSGITDQTIRSFVDSWMLAGAVSIACITVSFSSHSVMISDRQDGLLNDMLVSPVKRSTVRLSYFLYNVVVTTVICLIVLAIAFVYLAISGWYLSAADFFGLIGLTLLSILSSATLSTLVGGLFKTTASHSAFVGIMSAAIGFLVGAYMPLSLYPQGVRYLVLILPGTYSAAAFRMLFMRGALQEIGKASSEIAETLQKEFSMTLDFFGTELGLGAMIGILAAFTAVIGIIVFTVYMVKNRRKKVVKEQEAAKA